MTKNIYFCFFIFLLSCGKKDNITIQPQFITSDIDLFWSVYDDAASSHTQKTFQEQYVNKGSDGLKSYAMITNLANSLADTLAKKAYIDYYNSIKENTKDLNNAILIAKSGMNKLKDLYRPAKLFDVYFLIGAMKAGGKISDNGLLIAVELFSKTAESPINNLTEWHQKTTLQI